MKYNLVVNTIEDNDVDTVEELAQGLTKLLPFRVRQICQVIGIKPTKGPIRGKKKNIAALLVYADTHLEEAVAAYLSVRAAVKLLWDKVEGALKQVYDYVKENLDKFLKFTNWKQVVDFILSELGHLI